MRRPFRPRIEQLEDRTVPATHTWIGEDGNWSDPGNWLNGVPTSNEPGGTIVEFPITLADVTMIQDIPNLTIVRLTLAASGKMNLTLNQPLTIDCSGPLNITSTGLGEATITGNAINLINDNCDIFVNSSLNSNLTISSPITGPFGIIVTGAIGTGTLVLNAANTFTGATTIFGGTVQIVGAGTNNRLPANAAVVVHEGAVLDVAVVNPLPQGASAIDVFLSGGTFQMSGSSNSGNHVRNIAFTNGGTVKTSGTVSSFNGYNLFLNGNISVAGSGSTPATIDLQNGLGISGNHTFDVTNLTGNAAADLLITRGGIINESTGSITKTGGGTMVLAANSTYSGGTTISGGTLQIGNGGPAGSLGTGAVNNTSTLIFNRSNSFTVSNNITGAGGNLFLAGGTMTLSGSTANTYTGATTIQNGTLILSTNTSDAGLSGVVNVGDGTGTAGSAVLRIISTLEIPNTAVINVRSDGLLDIPFKGSEDVANLVLDGGQVTIFGGEFFRVTGNVLSTVTPGSKISGAGRLSLPGGNVTFNVANGPGTSDLTIGAVIENGGVIKTGAGALVLDGTNTYTGTTTLTAGELVVNGSQPGSPVNQTGGILSGQGTIGTLTTSGGSVYPTAALDGPEFPSTLHTGNAILNGSEFVPIIGGTQTDALAVTGTVNLNGALLGVAYNGTPVPGGTVFTLIENDGTDAIVGKFNGLPEGAIVTVNGRKYKLSYIGGSGNDVTITAPTTGHGPLIAVGGNPAGFVEQFTPTGPNGTFQDAQGFFPFGQLPGVHVRAYAGDVNGDGTPDTIAVTGPGLPIRLTVVSGVDDTTVLVPSFDPFGGNFTGGGFVGAADFDGDGREEFFVTPDEGGGPRVTIFSLHSDGTVHSRANFFGIDDPNFRGGARASAGDVNGDGVPDLAVSAGFLGGPRTALFNGSTVLASPTRLVNDFFAFPGTDAETLRNGVFVTVGDVNGDGFADMIFGGGPGGAPRVFILSGQTIVAGGGVSPAQEHPIANFFVAGNIADRGGIRVGTVDADGDSHADLVTGSGENALARMRIYRGIAFTSTGEPAAEELSVLLGDMLPGGVFVG